MEEPIMKIGFSKIYVQDQDKALKFYTEKLGFVKKADISRGSYRWLTVVAPEDKDGTELILELDSLPAAKALAQAMREQSMPAANFEVADVHKKHDELK